MSGNSNPASAAARWKELLELPAAQAGREAARYDWFAFLRLMQSAHPDLPRMGYATRPEFEPVRFGQLPFFHPPQACIAGFSTRAPGENSPSAFSTIEQLETSAGPSKKDVSPTAWVYSYHFGLFGPHGPLPLHLTELANFRNRRGDYAFSSFCNLLTHRLTCFFFRAWADARRDVTLDHPRKEPSPGANILDRPFEQPWENFLGAFFGAGLESQETLDSLPMRAKQFYAGRFAQSARNAEGLRAIIEDFFELAVPGKSGVVEKHVVNIIEFQPRTLPVPPLAQWRLGANSETGRLGWSTILGASVIEYQSAFRIEVGSLTLGQLESFLPGTERFNQVHDWVRLYCGEETEANPQAGLEAGWDFQLVLRASEVPRLALGTSCRLGYTTWLHSKTPAEDARDVVLRPSRRAATAAPVKPHATEDAPA